MQMFVPRIGSVHTLVIVKCFELIDLVVLIKIW